MSPRFIIESSFKSRAGYNGASMVDGTGNVNCFSLITIEDILLPMLAGGRWVVNNAG